MKSPHALGYTVPAHLRDPPWRLPGWPSLRKLAWVYGRKKPAAGGPVWRVRAIRALAPFEHMLERNSAHTNQTLAGLLFSPPGRAPGSGRTLATPTLLTPFCNNKSFIYSFVFKLRLRSLFPLHFLDNKPVSFAFRTDIQIYFLSLLFCDPTHFP